MATNFFAFGCVWATKFLILDKVLFKQDPLTKEPSTGSSTRSSAFQPDVPD